MLSRDASASKPRRASGRSGIAGGGLGDVAAVVTDHAVTPLF